MISIKSNKDFLKCYRKGKRFTFTSVVVYAFKNSSGLSRLGITASKKVVGNSPQRNRAKRIIRQAYRELGGFSPGYDIIISAKSEINFAKSTDLKKELSGLKI
ncbi:MAG: ribonuclease P protein component [Ruminococcus sp.]|nr:ribonuclease P protein component [Ruminococcus sp.]